MYMWPTLLCIGFLVHIIDLITGARFVQFSTPPTRENSSRVVKMGWWGCGTWRRRGRRLQSGGQATPVKSVAYPSSGT